MRAGEGGLRPRQISSKPDTNGSGAVLSGRDHEPLWERTLLAERWPSAAGSSFRLVIDHSAVQAKMTRDALAAHLDVTVFSSGADALEQLSAGSAPPALMVLDWYMPDLSSAEICRNVRATFNSAELPIIVSRAGGTNADHLQAIAAGANDFIKTPVSAVELTARVDGLLRLTELHSRLRRRNASFGSRRCFASGSWPRSPTTCANL